MTTCIICDKELTGRQTLFCSNACKQANKYQVKKGERCKACHKPITKPVPVLGGFDPLCHRKRCRKAD